MKKIILTLTLAVFAFAANAQLVISANIGGAMSSGDVFTNIDSSGAVTVNVKDTTQLDKTSNFTGGLKIGYKVGRMQFGVSGCYNMYTTTTETLDPEYIPILHNYAPTIYTTGTVEIKGSSFSIAPYFRYDVIQAGDVSIFVELSGFYTKSNNPMINATIHNEGTFFNMPISMDTNIVSPRPYSMTSIGARVTPGLSWQLSKHCGIDLYFDILSIAYTSTKTTKTDVAYTFVPNASGSDFSIVMEPTTYTTEAKNFGGALTGTPLLTELGENNWVRVGFNFTF